MLKLATVLDNPGEPMADTRYRDPRRLRDLGYNGMVLYGTTGLSGVDDPDDVGDDELKHWIRQVHDQVQGRIERAGAEGMEIFITYDVLSLSRPLFERRVEFHACRHQTETVCPASDAALEASAEALRSLTQRLPPIAGVVLRFGDNEAARLPHLVGNDIYLPHCARCGHLGRADRICRVIDRFYRLVVGELDRRLIARAWNLRPEGLHDSVDLCRRVLERIPEDDRLILSFKVSHTDFWRYQKWNPCSLVCGDRPVIYELECQREFEAKGAIPNWQVPLWRDGCPEVDDEAGGLADVAQRVNLAGLWAWVRGGGWGGPFVSDETWIDANVYAVPILADDPAVDPAKLAQQWIGERLGIDDPDLAAALEQILMHSPQVVLQGFYIQSFVDTRKSTWHPNADWIQDDLLDVSAAWRVVQRIPESALDAAIREKRDAVNRIASDRQALQHAMTSENRTTLAPLLHTLEYGEALFCTLRDLLSGLIAYRRYQARRDPEIAKQCGKHLLSAQNHWNLHTGRTGSRSGAATAFREVGFWERTQQILAEVGSESN